MFNVHCGILQNYVTGEYHTQKNYWTGTQKFSIISDILTHFPKKNVQNFNELM